MKAKITNKKTAGGTRPRRLNAADAALKARLEKRFAAFEERHRKWDEEHPNRVVYAYVPKEQKAWLERRAEEDGMSASELVARIIAVWQAKHEPAAVR